MKMSLSLNPRSVAVIGASAEETKVGHYVLQNIITQGYKGEIYPINPKGGEILGKKVYTSVSEIPGTVDMAVIVTPAKTVQALAEECGKKGVQTLIVISAGFGEIGTEEGHAMEKALAEMVARYKMTLVGPNCLGIIRPSIGLNASFAENVEKPGPVALLSQSGATAVALLDGAEKVGLSFSLVVSMGNKATQDECDFLEICRDDPETKVIGMYLESIKDGKRFLKIAKEVAEKKPIVLIKSGVSERGRKAVSSHTGALAGSDSAIDAVCRQTGVRRAHTTEQFLDMIRVLALEPALLSDRIAVITNAGGPGILATDAAEREGLILATLEQKTRDTLAPKLPGAASTANPVDVLGDAAADRYAAAIDACADDPNVDGIAVVLTPQVMTPEVDVAKAIIDAAKSRPLMPMVTSFMGEKNVTEAIALLHQHGIPNFATPERAIAALKTLRLPDLVTTSQPQECHTSALVQKLIADKSGLLDEDTTRELFALYDLPLPSQAVATSADDAVQIAEKLGYPVVAKISSPQILHKTDIGAVRINLKTADEVRVAYTEIIANSQKHMPTAQLQGVLLQRFLPAGHEFIVGAVRDQSFGHLILAGLGGIYTELFRDASVRIAPIVEEDAYRMLQDLRSWKLLLGLRGKGQSDIAALAKVIAQISHLVTDCPQIKELDLNPVLVWEDRVVIADAKIVLGDV